MEGKTYSGGIGFVGLLTLIFITLKLVGVAPVSGWSWSVVLSLIWGVFLLSLLMMACLFAVFRFLARK